MAADPDLVLRGGLVVDGLGGTPYQADVAVVGGRIAAVGTVSARGREEIDARGRLVTPGFVDVHTHYDGQVTWDNRLAPTSLHGITTAIMGNCGVGFAPCRPEHRDMLMRLMEGVEDIPGVVLADGVPWTWESYPEYLAYLSRRQYDIDFGGYVPHAALRVYVMGERATTREPATEADIARMQQLLREALAAGALGVGTSRTILHRSSDGRNTPTLPASERELTALAEVTAEGHRGLLQFVTDWDQIDTVLAEFGRIARTSGSEISFAMTQNHRMPQVWRKALDWTGAANDAGLSIKVQILPRPLGVLLSHELSMNPFFATRTYRMLAHLPFDQKIAALRQPDIRAAILSEPADDDPTKPLGVRVRFWDKQFELSDTPDYEPPPEQSIAAKAAQRGMAPEALAYDLLLENGGRTILYQAISNYAEGSLEPVLEMLRHKDTVPGLGDGGAHLGMICDGSYATSMLTLWGRDRTRGDRIPLPTVVKALSHDTAELVGLRDRGRIAPGYRADLNVIDFDRLHLTKPVIVRDLPGGGRRLMQRAVGYDATIVAGTVTYRHGEATGALPGRLVRGRQRGPS